MRKKLFPSPPATATDFFPLPLLSLAFFRCHRRTQRDIPLAIHASSWNPFFCPLFVCKTFLALSVSERRPRRHKNERNGLQQNNFRSDYFSVCTNRTVLNFVRGRRKPTESESILRRTKTLKQAERSASMNDLERFANRQQKFNRPPEQVVEVAEN